MIKLDDTELLHEIIETIDAVNVEIRNIVDAFGEANCAIVEANALIKDWNGQHPDREIEMIEELDDLPEEIDEIDQADLFETTRFRNAPQRGPL
jgi:hypothetical protein